MPLSDDMLENYRTLVATSGESLESIVARVAATGDAATAAELRAVFAPAEPAPKRAAPSGKRTATTD